MEMLSEAALEGLSDAEVDTPMTRFGLAVDQQIRNPIQLVAEVDAGGADRGQVPQPWTGRKAEIAASECQRVRPDVAVVEERHAPEVSAEGHADFGRSFEHREATDRQAEATQRT